MTAAKRHHTQPLTPQGKACDCDFCTRWLPRYHRIRSALHGADRIAFEEFAEWALDCSEHLEIAQAKLDGTLPGWEWLPSAIRLKQ